MDVTSTSTSATNLDTVAISGLTVDDSLLVIIRASGITQITGRVTLYNNTDGVTIADGNDISPGEFVANTCMLATDQSANTRVTSNQYGWNAFSATDIGGSTRLGNVSVTTAWTGSWTLALRSSGVTAGGTLRWAWRAYKLAGQ